MQIPFTKLHGNGNDFILIDETAGPVIPDEMKADFAAVYCDRRFGIGGDGVLFLLPSESADVRMRLFQPDRSEAEMCGNGIRCLAKFAFEAGYMGEKATVETMAGIMAVEMGYNGDGYFWATIEMPAPAFTRSTIPATGEGDYKEEIGPFTVHATNTGVPHAVIFVDDVEAVDVAVAAPPIRRHPTFPNGANVNFVQVTGEASIRIRTFERGIEGETESCGTGATASAAVAHHLGLVGDEVEVETNGGPLVISLGERTLMRGPAETVYYGVIEA
ncbi:diaminopimelate epimerase [Methanofollis fontis]|uniref:Diaminopimelate epimerase n=1 Tax=Methanofollis fontis TaxID=2052832 RepID=A0A483CW25_9EURY|nr:diaminopimelate epimerase [Methanofollis fontis]TAJ45731.1 diaminopimelate epimerase [Methanofollis fontis]